MADIATHFPPQTYSSSFFLNSLTDDDKVGVSNSKEGAKKNDSSAGPLLDCFISTFLSGDRRNNKSRFRENGENEKQQQQQQPINKDHNTNNTANKDHEVADIWKTRHSNTTKTAEQPQSSQHQQLHQRLLSESPHKAFKRWRKTRNGLLNNNSSNGTLSANRLLGNGAAMMMGGSQTGDQQQEEDMTLLKFLAINALDLSAPASDVLLKSRNSSWFQLSGHPDSLAPAGPGTVWKKRAAGVDDTERIVYEELSQDPDLCDIIPKYYREVDYQGEKFIELQDLLHGFQDPYVMDIKMGTRTFLESEVKKTKARSDLYQKMISIDPEAPTKEEHSRKAVTKLRYMQFREQQSSTCSHGFRIEAMKCRGSPPVTDLKTVKSHADVRQTLDSFLTGRHQRHDVRQRVLHRLNEIRAKIEQSEYFKGREVVGSSLFIIYDDNKVGVWLIDFAKTNRLPEDVRVDHRTPWVQGNHEEGLLFGLDRLISVIESIEHTSPSRGSKEHLAQALPAVSVRS